MPNSVYFVKIVDIVDTLIVDQQTCIQYLNLLLGAQKSHFLIIFMRTEDAFVQHLLMKVLNSQVKR